MKEKVQGPEQGPRVLEMTSKGQFMEMAGRGKGRAARWGQKDGGL